MDISPLMMLTQQMAAYFLQSRKQQVFMVWRIPYIMEFNGPDPHVLERRIVGILEAMKGRKDSEYLRVKAAWEEANRMADLTGEHAAIRFFSHMEVSNYRVYSQLQRGIDLSEQT